MCYHPKTFWHKCVKPMRRRFPSQSNQHHQFGLASLLGAAAGQRSKDLSELLLSFRAVKHIHLHPCPNSINTLFCFSPENTKALIGHEAIYQGAAWYGCRVPIASGSCFAAAPRLHNGWCLPQNSINVLQSLPLPVRAECEPKTPLLLLINSTRLYSLLGLGQARSRLSAGNKDDNVCFQLSLQLAKRCRKRWTDCPGNHLKVASLSGDPPRTRPQDLTQPTKARGNF